LSIGGAVHKREPVTEPILCFKWISKSTGSQFPTPLTTEKEKQSNEFMLWCKMTQNRC